MTNPREDIIDAQKIAMLITEEGPFPHCCITKLIQSTQKAASLISSVRRRNRPTNFSGGNIMPSIVDTFVNAATGLLTSLPRNIQGHRAEALEAVLELGSALQRSIDLSIIYLKGVESIDDPAELDAYLRDGRNKLRHMSDEFKICQRLYALRDKFRSMFSTAGFAVSQDAQDLVDILVHGERSVIDEIVHSVPYGAPPGDNRVGAQIRQSIIELQEQSEGIRKAVRQFVDSM